MRSIALNEASTGPLPSAPDCFSEPLTASVTVAYGTGALAQYQGGFAPDGRHIRAVTGVRLFETRHPSPQPYLAGLAETAWQAALRVERPARRPGPPRTDGGRLPLFDDAQVATG